MDGAVTGAGGAAGAVRGQHAGGLVDGVVDAADARLDGAGPGIDEAKIGGGQGLRVEQEGFCARRRGVRQHGRAPLQKKEQTV